MRRNPRTVRLSDAELEALTRAAADDKRQPAALMAIIIGEWLEAKGYLKAATEPAAPTKRRPAGERRAAG